MGQQGSRQLRHARRGKETEDGVGADPDVRYGASACQGYRESMEDAHCCQVSMPGGVHLFAVFDGHGGSGTAQLAAQLLPQHMQAITAQLVSMDSAGVSEAIRKVFLAVDKEICSRMSSTKGSAEESGATCTGVLVTREKLIFINLGDSRTFVTMQRSVRFHTLDHKPDDPPEASRIEKAGGWLASGRVCGILGVSRAFGDLPLKETEGLPPEHQMVSPIPDVTVLQRLPEDEFVFVGCDGVFDVMSNEAVAVFLRNTILQEEKLSSACSALLDTCLAKGSTDNLSSILVCFPAATRKEQVSQMIDDWFDGFDDDSENAEGGAAAAAAAAAGAAPQSRGQPPNRRPSINLRPSTEEQEDSFA
eukprot:m.84701 g.84701  ORF g.84701 m.84701 type:complete len:362 (-) comp14816_c0_seq3:109-1194(-)